MSCPCDGKKGLELAVCLAPPPGDYEAVIDLGQGKHLVINTTGLYVRNVVSDDYLPFIRTTSIKVSEATLRRLGLSDDVVLCAAIKSLQEAAEHGSEAAALVVHSCEGLLKQLLDKCNTI